ncbi:mevalonate kinase [Myxococcota bacterium]|nr:mevalonate kinase [Myxococcota bacterium]
MSGAWIGRAPGKLILLGEHSVVVGHRAIAAAVSRGTTVRLDPIDGPTRLGESAIQDDRLMTALQAVLPAEGLEVHISTDLPVGRGMGSSAALAIALLRARAAREGRAPSFAELHRDGFVIERVFHGNPSGLDHCVVAMGGAVLYRRGEAPTPLQMPSYAVVVLDSGVAGDTGQLVAGVASRRPGVDPALNRLGELVELALPALHDPHALGGIMNEAHGRLREIGVSTPSLDDMCALALQNGALGAKLSGAGGGGVVLALCPDGGEGLVQAAARRKIAAFACRLPEA